MARGRVLGSSVLGVTLVVQTSASVHQGTCVCEEAVEAHLPIERLVGVGVWWREMSQVRADQ
jgi:hypothetical protein